VAGRVHTKKTQTTSEHAERGKFAVVGQDAGTMKKGGGTPQVLTEGREGDIRNVYLSTAPTFAVAQSPEKKRKSTRKKQKTSGRDRVARGRWGGSCDNRNVKDQTTKEGAKKELSADHSAKQKNGPFNLT